MTYTLHKPLLPCLLLVALWLGCDKPTPQETPTTSKTATKASAPTTAPKAKEPVKEPSSPQGSLLPPTVEQRKLLAQAKVLLLQDKLTEAEPLFEKLSGLGPWSGERVSATIALGDIYLQTGREAKALALYQDLLKKANTLPEVHLVVGRAMIEVGKKKEAVEVYKKALELQPLYLFLWVELGQLYQMLGEPQKSADALLNYERKLYAMAKELENPVTPVAARLNGIEAFGMIEDDKVTQTLIKIMRAAPEPQVRRQAAVALADARAVSSLADLRAVAKGDQNKSVKAAALQSIEALEKLGPAASDDVKAPTFVKEPGKVP